MNPMRTSFMISALFFVLGCEPRPVPPVVSQGQGVVVAKMGDALVTDKQLLERIAAIQKSFPKTYASHIQKKALVTEMLNIELLYQEALAHGLEKKYEFKSRLADLYVRQLAEQARSKITETQLNEYFEAHRHQIEQISARHILLKTKNEMSASAKSALKARLMGLREELLKNPSEFANYARKHSEDSSRESGGELGFFTFGQMVKPFSEAAFKLKNIDDISSVVESEFGFHLIQLSGDRRGLAPYQELIREQLFRKVQREMLDQEVARLKGGREFQIYEDVLVKLSPLPSEILSNPKDLIPEEVENNDVKKP